MIWAYTSKGTFSVKSAYKVAMAMDSIGSLGESSTNHNQTQFWKKLWRLYIPNKVKSFAWRACKNIIPTKANLCQRKVIDDPICEACSDEAESGGHVF